MERNKEKVRVKIADLRHPEKNTRKHPQKQINEMKRSLDMFGQFRDVVVDEGGVILVGNGLVTAMRELGWEECEALRYIGLTENEKKKLMIADNQVASLGVDDYSAIEEILRSLGGDYDVPGYDEETLNMLVEEYSAVAEDINSYGQFDAVEVQKLNEVKEEREEHGFEPVRTAAPVANAPQNASDGAVNGEKVYAKTVDEGKYIICPHCGEKVYL